MLSKYYLMLKNKLLFLNILQKNFFHKFKYNNKFIIKHQLFLKNETILKNKINPGFLNICVEKIRHRLCYSSLHLNSTKHMTFSHEKIYTFNMYKSFFNGNLYYNSLNDLSKNLITQDICIKMFLSKREITPLKTFNISCPKNVISPSLNFNTYSSYYTNQLEKLHKNELDLEDRINIKLYLLNKNNYVFQTKQRRKKKILKKQYFHKLGLWKNKQIFFKFKQIENYLFFFKKINYKKYNLKKNFLL